MKKKHFNLYYIFKEDMEAHPMPPPKAGQIWLAIQAFLKKKQE